MAVLAITMEQGWMIGIIGLMCVFGICAAIFYRMGKKNNPEEQAKEE